MLDVANLRVVVPVLGEVEDERIGHRLLHRLRLCLRDLVNDLRLNRLCLIRFGTSFFLGIGKINRQPIKDAFSHMRRVYPWSTTGGRAPFLIGGLPDRIIFPVNNRIVPHAKQKCREANFFQTAKCGLFCFLAIRADKEVLGRSDGLVLLYQIDERFNQQGGFPHGFTQIEIGIHEHGHLIQRGLIGGFNPFIKSTDLLRLTEREVRPSRGLAGLVVVGFRFQGIAIHFLIVRIDHFDQPHQNFGIGQAVALALVMFPCSHALPEGLKHQREKGPSAQARVVMYCHRFSSDWLTLTLIQDRLSVFNTQQTPLNHIITCKPRFFNLQI